ncbi:hypothetical protein M3J07_004830 [Ascochyta lentis]
MTIEQLASPNTPSQTSIMIHESIEPGQTVGTPPASIMQSSVSPNHTPGPTDSESSFQPFQMLMDSVISIEYGDELQDSCSVHEGMICCHSPQAQLWCTQAKPLREQYDKCEELARKFTSFSMLGLTAAKYEENKVESRAASLITYADNHFPLSTYQPNVSKLIKDALAAQVTDGHVKDPKTKITTKSYLERSFNGRLTSLNWQGMLNMMERLCGIIGRIRAAEMEKGKKDQIRAMAQKRIILRGTSNASIQSLLAWIYQGNLHYKSSEHLYEVYELAIKLRVDALAETCLSQLFNTASDVIHETHCQGVTLDALLGFKSAGEADELQNRVVPDNTVEIIFHHVLTDKNPPARLSDLVVDIMARKMHSKLWAQIQETISRPIALRLVEAMLQLKELKAECAEHPGLAIKSEDRHSTSIPS